MSSTVQHGAGEGAGGRALVDLRGKGRVAPPHQIVEETVDPAPDMSIERDVGAWAQMQLEAGEHGGFLGAQRDEDPIMPEEGCTSRAHPPSYPPPRCLLTYPALIRYHPPRGKEATLVASFPTGSASPWGHDNSPWLLRARGWESVCGCVGARRTRRRATSRRARDRPGDRRSTARRARWRCSRCCRGCGWCLRTPGAG